MRQQDAVQREAHLRDYWRVIWRGRYTALTILVLVIGGAILRTALATPIYRATVMVEIKPEAQRVLPGQEQWVGSEGRSWIAEELYFNTQIEVLKSRDLAERVTEELHLGDHPRFAKAKDPVGVFQRLVTVRGKPNTRIIEISIEGDDPPAITEWVNSLAETYVQRNVDKASESFVKLMDEVERSLASFRIKLGQTAGEGLEAAADQQLYVPEDQREILRTSLQTYNNERDDLQIRLGKLEAENREVTRLREEGGDLTVLPRFYSNMQVQALNSQKLEIERDLKRTSAEKRPRHPEYVGKRQQLDQLESKLAEKVREVEQELRKEYELAISNANYLDGLIAQTERAAYRVRQATSDYDLAQADAESKRQVYDVVAETVNQLSVGQTIISMNNNVTLLDQAIEPMFPIRPVPLVTIGLGGFLGLLLGVGAVLFIDYLDNTIRSPEDVEQYLGLSMLAIIPRYSEISGNIVKEAFQSLRTSVLFLSHNREKRVILFSSAGPQEGKSSTVAQISRSLASAGDRVIVLDCDLRRPTQHKHLNVEREPGVTNYLMKPGSSYQSFMQSTDHPNLTVLTCGAIPPNPAEVVGLARFRELLNELRQEFDWVIIDSPPIAGLADAVVLASLADTMIMVIKHNVNDRDLILNSLKRLRDTNVEIAGAVLNGVDASGARYGQYSYMYDYYEPRDEEKGDKKRRRRRASRRPEEPGSRNIAL